MAQFVSAEFQRLQSLYANAELAHAIALHDLGKASSRFLSERIRAVSNIQHDKPAFSHRFTGKKGYSHG